MVYGIVLNRILCNIIPDSLAHNGGEEVGADRGLVTSSRKELYSALPS